MSPEDIIRELGMQPHPEGGWYVQTFRDRQAENAATRQRSIIC